VRDATQIRRRRTEAIAAIRAQPGVITMLLVELFEAEVDIHKESMLANGAEPLDIASSRAAALALRALANELSRPERSPEREAARKLETHNLDPIAGI
jgi:hypothetical protein